MNSTEILSRLIGFNTISKHSNRDLMSYVSELLASHGIQSTLIPNKDGSKANLYATVGPRNKRGVMLSGHTDVVPVEGQDWRVPAFELTEHQGRFYGRGTADMKGFVACAIMSALNASKLSLTTPLHLALSYDEEIGCVGVASLIDLLAAAPITPAMCIVGEPTNLSVATGHKGKTALVARCTGKEGHSALAPHALNAIHLGCDFVQALRKKQTDLARQGQHDTDYDVPYTTLHAAKIQAGVALNIVPNYCEVDFEIRHIAEDDPQSIIRELDQSAALIVADARTIAPQAGITLEKRFSYPGLDTPANAQVVDFVKSLCGANSTIKVAFGTEGGLFSSQLGVPTVVCGPGSMAQGHKPDEYVEISQINRCDAMLKVLNDRLVQGL